MRKLIVGVLLVLLCAGLCYADDPVCKTYEGTLPYVTCGSTWWTGIAVSNKSSVEACMYMRYADTHWKCYKIAQHGVTTLVLDCPGATYAEFKSSMPLTIFMAMSDNNIAFDYVMELELCSPPEEPTPVELAVDPEALDPE